jgi:hypothetical protein
MKSKLLFFLLLLCFNTNAQITDLQKFSNGKLYDEAEIKDENNNVKGYFLLFETDKIAKKTYTLEYVVLDENLTKVTNGFITEMKFESLLVSADRVSVLVTLFNNKLLIQFSEKMDSGDGVDYFKRYRILDLKSNKLSEMFNYFKGKLNVNPDTNRKFTNFDEGEAYKILGVQNVGLVVDKNKKDKFSDEKSLICYDENFNQKWKTDYELKKNEFGNKELKFLKSDNDNIVFFNHYTKGGYYKPTVSVLIFNSKTGALNKEYFFPNEDKNSYKVVDCSLGNNQVVLLGNYSKKQDYGNISDEENTGLFKIILDAKSGKVIKETYNNWANMASKFNINKYGYIKNEGNIFIHNMLELSDNKIIAVCEAFSNSPIKTNNIYFLEFSKNLDLTQVFEIEKFRNKFPGVSDHSNNIKKYGLFDFMDYQNMGDDEFLFYYSDNEKNTKNRKKSTIFGIVSYSNGKFSKQSLNLKTEISSINAFSAKKGYILLSENFDEKDKPTELRLEKINY